MKAIRIKDKEIVYVEKIDSNLWKDTLTGEQYILHIDIELLYG